MSRPASLQGRDDPDALGAGARRQCRGRRALIGEAKSAGAEYVLTPEMTNIMEVKRERLFATIVEEDADTSLATFRELARKLGIYLHVGSLAIKVSPDKAANRSFLIDPKGDIAARYDKIHMFDVDLAGGESYRESRTYRPGELAVLRDLPWGRLGLTICYDLRFPALYRALAEAGATMLAIPSAFTQQTGEAHWHVLMRARAIENGCFVFAAAQGGKHENGRETFGHSLIVDPWGRILAEGGTEPGVVMAEIDLAEVAKARARIPSLQHGRRFEIVEPMAEPTHLHVVQGGRMIRYALVCDQGHDFESWFAGFGGLRQAGQARAGDLPALRLGQGRKGDHGAAAGRRRRSARRRPSRRAAAAGRAGKGAGRDAVAAGTGVPHQAQGTARPSHQERRPCRAEISRGSAQDALRRDRAPLDLRRGLARGSQGAGRGRHRIPSAADFAGRAELICTPSRPSTARAGTHLAAIDSPWLCAPPSRGRRSSIRPHQQRDADHHQHDADGLARAWSAA